MGRFTHVHGNPSLECILGDRCPRPDDRFHAAVSLGVRSQAEAPYDDLCSGCGLGATIVWVQDYARPRTHLCGPCLAARVGTRPHDAGPRRSARSAPGHREGCTHRGCHPDCEAARVRRAT